MTHLVARFPNQAAAMSAVQRLEGRGYPQARLVPIAEGGVRGSPDSYNVPSNVVSSVSNKARRSPVGGPANRRIDEIGPEAYGVVRLELDTADGDLNENDLRALLEEAGAERIETSSSPPPEETRGIWPEPPLGDAVDVERAIQASRRGAAESPGDLPAPGDAPSRKTRHDPHR